MAEGVEPNFPLPYNCFTDLLKLVKLSRRFFNFFAVRHEPIIREVEKMYDIIVKRPLSSMGILAMGVLLGFLFYSVHFDRTEEVKNLQFQLEQCRRDVMSCANSSKRCREIVSGYKLGVL